MQEKMAENRHFSRIFRCFYKWNVVTW